MGQVVLMNFKSIAFYCKKLLAIEIINIAEYKMRNLLWKAIKTKETKFIQLIINVGFMNMIL